MDEPTAAGDFAGDFAEDRRVRVRVNFSGRRCVGVIRLPDGVARVSDVLNDGHHFIYLEEVQTMGGSPSVGGLALNKDQVTFIQALEEPVATNPSLRRQGNSLGVEVSMKHMDLHIRGKIFLPEGATPTDILNDERNFLSLSDVEVVGTNESFPYLALCKTQVMAVEILGTAEVPAHP